MKGLSIPPAAPVDKTSEATAHYALAAIASSLNDYTLAASHYETASKFAADAPDFTPDQRLGIREKLAYVLHEAGRLQEALDVNTDLLKQAEILFGPNSAKLTTVLTNTAQIFTPQAEAQKRSRIFDAAWALPTRVATSTKNKTCCSSSAC